MPIVVIDVLRFRNFFPVRTVYLRRQTNPTRVVTHHLRVCLRVRGRSLRRGSCSRPIRFPDSSPISDLRHASGSSMSSVDSGSQSRRANTVANRSASPTLQVAGKVELSSLAPTPTVPAEGGSPPPPVTLTKADAPGRSLGAKSVGTSCSSKPLRGH
jgi:hypothetical protein